MIRMILRKHSLFLTLTALNKCLHIILNSPFICHLVNALYPIKCANSIFNFYQSHRNHTAFCSRVHNIDIYYMKESAAIRTFTKTACGRLKGTDCSQISIFVQIIWIIDQLLCKLTLLSSNRINFQR